MSPIVTIQRRMMELGRIRLGDKGSKGEPRRLHTFRLTSASRALLTAAASVYGGTVREWKDAPDEGYFELYTDASELEIVLPPTFSDRDGTPTTSYSQWFEAWTGAGCQRRCDGETEALSGQPCVCRAEGVEPGEGDPKKGQCKVTTRVSVMLPRIPGVGVWRLESHGWNAATVLPGTLEIIRLASEQEGQFIPAVLRIEQKTAKRDGQTRRFIVPVIDLPETRLIDMAALSERGARAMNAGQPRSESVPRLQAVNPPAAPPAKPALTAGQPLPEDPAFQVEETAPFGPPAALPGADDASSPASTEPAAGAAGSSPAIPNIEQRVVDLLDLAEKAGADVDAVLTAVTRREQAGGVTDKWLDQIEGELREHMAKQAGS